MHPNDVRVEEEVLQILRASETVDDGATHPCNLLTQHLNDYGNGQRVIALYGQEMRYSDISRSWVTWEATHWLLDAGGRARRRSQDTIVEFGKQAMAARNEDAAKFAARCLNSQRITNALREAEPHLTILP